MQIYRLVQMNQLSTKEKIIAKSLAMFNEYGVENITTRHIAKELGISQGNLHYHYPNKNEILSTLFHNFIHQIKSAERFNGTEFNTIEMYESMLENFRIMDNYRLFFQQNEVIWRRIPEIKNGMVQLFLSKKNEILDLIHIYKSEGKFRQDISASQIDFLAEQFIFTIQSWLMAKNYHPQGHSAEHYAKFLFRSWLPYLNNETMKKWEEIL